MIDWSKVQEVVVLTGTGISPVSEISVYRERGGIRVAGERRVSKVRSRPDTDLWSVWQRFGPLLSQLSATRAGPVHEVLAQLERRFPGRFALITECIDGLHQQAGSKNVLELRGNVTRRRCTNPGCALKPYRDLSAPSRLPTCEVCGYALRPDVLLNNHVAEDIVDLLASRALRTADLFLSIGDPGTVFPIRAFADAAKRAGALTLELHSRESGLFENFLEGPPDQTLSGILSGLPYPIDSLQTSRIQTSSRGA